MGKKGLAELEADLQKLKEREAKIKEEMALQKKQADENAKRERNRKIFRMAEMLITHLGDCVLEHMDEFEIFIMEHAEELKQMIR